MWGNPSRIAALVWWSADGQRRSAMSMEQVERDQALGKREFHSRLRRWISETDDATIGPEHVDGRTNWLFVRDGDALFGLHADTRREAVERYLKLVAVHGENLVWKIVPSQRKKMTAVAYGPLAIRTKSFYLYVVE